MKQKIALKEYYAKEHKVKVSHKIMASLKYDEFEEYLKRRHYEVRLQKSAQVLRRHLLGFLCKIRFK
jgi:hypothetical protein